MRARRLPGCPPARDDAGQRGPTLSLPASAAFGVGARGLEAEGRPELSDGVDGDGDVAAESGDHCAADGIVADHGREAGLALIAGDAGEDGDQMQRVGTGLLQSGPGLGVQVHGGADAGGPGPRIDRAGGGLGEDGLVEVWLGGQGVADRVVADDVGAEGGELGRAAMVGSMPSRGHIQVRGSMETGPATTAETKPSSMERLVARGGRSAPARTRNHRSRSSRDMAVAAAAWDRRAASRRTSQRWRGAAILRAAFQFEARNRPGRCLLMWPETILSNPALSQEPVSTSFNGPIPMGCSLHMSTRASPVSPASRGLAPGIVRSRAMRGRRTRLQQTPQTARIGGDILGAGTGFEPVTFRL